MALSAPRFSCRRPWCGDLMRWESVARSPAGTRFRARGVALFLGTEVDARGLLLLRCDIKRRHRLGRGIHQGAPDPARKRGELGIVDAHRLDVIAPRDGDAVFRALE